MLCEKCKEHPASVHVSQNVNGQKTEHYLCHKCAFDSGQNMTFDSFFKSFLDGMPGQKADLGEGKDAPVVCASCGMTFDEFKKSGRLGCAECYTTFSERLKQAFKSVQAGLVHQGKIPGSLSGEILKKRNLEKLRSEIRAAIENEEYEKAAVLRDKIKELNISVN